MELEKGNPLFLPIVALLIVGYFSTIFSINPVISLLGSYKRYDGLLSLMIYVFLFYIVVTHVDRKTINLFVTAIIITAGLICVYGFCQGFGFDFSWSTSFGFGGRMMSTLGHPAFLSAYLTMILPLIYYKAIKCRNLYSLCFYLLCIILLLISFYLTKTRATFIGLILSNICFFVLIGKAVIKSNKVKIAIILSIIIGISIVFNFKANSPIKRAVSDLKVISAEKAEKAKFKLSGTIYTRWQTAQIAIEVIKDFPVFGLGYDCFGIVYLYYLEEYLEIHKDATIVKEIQDRVHNDILDTMVQTGIIGLCVYLWFVGTCVWIYKNKRSMLATAILAGLCAYMVQNQFSFGHIPILMMFWVMLGFLVVECKVKGE
jgi:O-antigen ligase